MNRPQSIWHFLLAISIAIPAAVLLADGLGALIFWVGGGGK